MTPPSFKAASAYHKVGLQTRAPQHDQHQLVALMYEAVLENLAKARGAIEQGDMPAKLTHIDKAVRIVQEGLHTSLDMDNGGELAANLAALYEYCVLRMTQANAANDAAALSEVANLIRPLAEAWSQIRDGQGPGTGGGPSAPESEPARRAAPESPGQGNKMLRQLGHLYGVAGNAHPGAVPVGA